MAAIIEGLENRRLMASGSVDNTFNGIGNITTRVPAVARESRTVASQVVVDAVGRTLVAAKTNVAITLYRLDEKGAPDASFAADSGGFLRIALPKALQNSSSASNRTRIAVDASNRYYVLIGPQVIRLTSSGKIDRTYGRRGNATLSNFRQAGDLAVTDDGVVYVTGTFTPKGKKAGRMAVERLTSTGVPDAAFGSAGAVAAPIIGPSTSNPGVSTGNFIRILRDGSVEATGALSVSVQREFGNSNGTGAVTLKFKADGSVDAAFGKKGRSIYSVFTGDVSFPEALPVAIRGDGAVLLAASGSDDSADGHFVQVNVIEAANGRSSANVDLIPGRDDIVQTAEFAYNTNIFPGAAAVGGEYLTESDRALLYRFTKAGVIDTTFNAGQPLAGVTAAATTSGGAVVVAGTGSQSEDTRLTVRRVFEDEAPSVQAIAAPVLSATKVTTVTFRIRDDDGVSTLNTNEEFSATAVLDSHNPVVGRRIGGTVEADGTYVLTYGFVGPGGGWDNRDNGRYLLTTSNAVDAATDVSNYSASHSSTLLVKVV